MPAWPWPRSSRAASLARVALMLAGLGRLDDPDNYLDLARSLAEGRVLPRRPADRLSAAALSILLAPLVAPRRSACPGAWAALHLALGAGTVLPRLMDGPAVGALAGPVASRRRRSWRSTRCWRSSRDR